MKIVPQKLSLPVSKHYIIDNLSLLKKHGPLFGGDSKRGLIVGPSGCGKTNVMMSLIEHPNGLRFENIYLYSKSLYQSKYKYLRLLLEPLKEIGYYEYNDGDEVILPEKIKSNSVIIFDDVALCNQDIIKSYFCFGRHKNTDCFYLCQCYSSIPKQLIRTNANLIIIFQQDKRNLTHIYEDHVNSDMSFDEFKSICIECWKDAFGFIVIDKDCSRNKGKYRKGFDKFIQI